MVATRFRALLMSLAVVGLAHPVAADPPDRVARISYITGSVSFRAAGMDEWSTATRNYPLTVGDHLWTDRNGRAELELDSTFIRIAPSTELSVLNLDNRIAQLRVTQGTATLRVRDLADESVEIDTPNGAVTIDQPGFYRIDVNDSGSRTDVTARSGRAEVTAGDAAYVVEGRQSIVLGDSPSPQPLQTARAPDDFEDWCLARDRRFEGSASARYLSPRMIGYEDLDDYGVWGDASGYGRAWYPRVLAGWVPYRFGHWAWIEPWGWTWIDDEPWGFAPFHYGRWLHAPGGWAWIPGYAAARPVYAPALVALVGGPGWQASFSFGTAPVGWFPLGPREPFVPAYGASFGYLRAVNAPQLEWRSNLDLSHVRYVNRDVPGALTAVPRDAFVRARPANSAAIAVPRDAFRNSASTQAAPGRPSRTDVTGGERRGPAPPLAAIDRSVVVRQTPPAATRVPFRRAPQATAPPRPASVQPGRPGRSGQPIEPPGPQHVPQPRPQPERAVPRDRQQPERVAQRQRVQPQGRRQERVIPPQRWERAAPPERVAPPVRSQPQRVIPLQRPQQERVGPPERVATPARPQPERIVPPERVVPKERPRPERAASRDVAPPPPHQAAPQQRAAPPSRGTPQDHPHEGPAAQPRPQGGRVEEHKKDKK